MVVFLFDCWISQVFDEVQEDRYIADSTMRDNMQFCRLYRQKLPVGFALVVLSRFKG